MVTTPRELNGMSDDILLERVRAVLGSLEKPTLPCLPPIAPFVTASVLLRLHNFVQTERQRCHWNKQAAMAMVVASFTGVKLQSKAEAEHIGNAQDTYLRHHCNAVSKVKQSQAVAASKARKAGKEVPPVHAERIAGLEERVYRCTFGGVPRNVVIPDAPQQVGFGAPIHVQPVPFRKIEFADETNLRLKVELVEACERERTLKREGEREARQLLARAEREEDSRKRVERAAADEAEARRAAEEEAARTLQAEKKAAAQAALEAEARIARLGSQVAAAHFEAATVISREQKARKRAQKLVADEVEARGAAEEAAAQLARTLQAEKKAAAQARTDAEARIARLGSQVAAAHFEAGRAAEREEQARKQVQNAVAENAEARRAAEEEAAQAVKKLQAEKKSAAQAATDAEARIARLGSQVAAAHFEAAKVADREEQARRRAQELEQLVEQKEQAAENLRRLKASMAKRKREAEAMARGSYALEKDLKESRKQSRKLRVQLSSLKAQLCVQEEEWSSDSRSSAADSGEDEVANTSNTVSLSVLQLDPLRALERINSMPTWRAVPTSNRGAFKLEWGTRVAIYSLLALLVPPSAVGPTIVVIVKRTAPWLSPSAVTCETVQRCRFELRLLEEILAARRIADAYRLRGIGFDETTKFGQNALTSNVTIEPTEGAPLEDVILRAAYCPMGGTAEKVVQSIKEKCFSRLRHLLRRSQAQFESMFPGEQWTGPNPAQCSLARLGGGAAIMSDTCSTARLTKRLLAEEVAKLVEEHMGSERWAAMSAEEQEAATRTHSQDCWQHLRNIFLAEMSKAMAAHVKEELQPELDTFSAWERMSTEFSQLLRAAYKEFHHGCRYYKGKGREYGVWLSETHGKAFVIHLERAEGGRQDLDFDAAIPLYVDRCYFIDYLHDIVFGKGHSNILEDFLYVTFRSLQFVAMTRANAIIDIHVSRPLRWLSGKARELQNWSPVSMGEALDLVHDLFERAQYDGSLFLDPNLDIFKPIADRQPLFAAWRKFLLEEDYVLSPDGSTKHLLYKLVKDELLEPKDATNVQTRAKTIEYLELQCRAGLKKMRDPKLALRDKLSSQTGANSIGNARQQHLDTIGCHATNDVLAESVFGTYDMVLRRFGGISMEAASGVSQAVRSQMLSLGDNVARRKASTKPEEHAFRGYFHSLPEREQEAYVEFCRITLKEMRNIDRADHAALDEYHKMRRKKNQEDALEALFTRYALALSFFERWVKRGIEKKSDINVALRGYGTEGTREQEKLDWLREQIEMRVIGLSWTGWATPWSSSTDEEIGTISQLVAHLQDVLLEEERLHHRGELPSKTAAALGVDQLANECPAPQFQRRTFKCLGTPTAQATSLSDDRINLSAAEVLAAAQKTRVELEASGQIDWVSDRQPYPTGQGPVPDKNLIGKVLEVRWRYRHVETGEPVYIWCEGEVVQVADGDKDKVTARCKKILPAGALQIKWAADVEYDERETFVWSILKPASFNKDVHLGWRFAARELQRMEAAGKKRGASDVTNARRSKKK